jgi:hypothetical protein
MLSRTSAYESDKGLAKEFILRVVISMLSSSKLQRFCSSQELE